MNKLLSCLVILFLISCEKDETTDSKKNSDINAGLTAFYKFDNENVDDDSGNNLNGVLINLPSFTEATINGKGKAIFLNGIKEQFINIPYNPFKDLKKYSVSLWIKDFGTSIIFSGISSNGVNNDFPRLYANSDGKFTFCTGYEYTNAPPFTYLYKAIQDEKWHMITVIVDRDEETSDYSTENIKYLYIDGKLVDTQKGEYTTNNSCTKIQIGGDGDGKYNTFSSNMKVDNIRFYNRAISSVEVLEMFNYENN